MSIYEKELQGAVRSSRQLQVNADLCWTRAPTCVTCVDRPVAFDGTIFDSMEALRDLAPLVFRWRTSRRGADSHAELRFALEVFEKPSG